MSLYRAQIDLIDTAEYDDPVATLEEVMDAMLDADSEHRSNFHILDAQIVPAKFVVNEEPSS